MDHKTKRKSSFASTAVLLLWFLIAPASRAAPSLAGKRVLWLGDSITADGRYVSFIEYYLERRFPDRKFDFVSIGLSSETASGLSEAKHPFPRPCVIERLQRALDLVKPGIVVACYGMNDGIYHPPSPERLRAFQSGIEKLISAAKAAGASVILLTPTPFDPLPVRAKLRQAGASDSNYSYMTPYEKYDTVLADYARWEKTLPARKAFVVDLRKPLTEYSERERARNPSFSFSADAIHPSESGHLLMALTILKALDVPIPVTNLDAEVTRLNGDPMFKLVSQRRETRSKGWLAFVGYTRGETVKAASVDDAELSARALQRQIDQLRKR